MIFFNTDYIAQVGILVDHHFVKLFVFICGDMNGVTPHSGQLWGQILSFCIKRNLSDTRAQLKLKADFEGEIRIFF